MTEYVKHLCMYIHRVIVYIQLSILFQWPKNNLRLKISSPRFGIYIILLSSRYLQSISEYIRLALFTIYYFKGQSIGPFLPLVMFYDKIKLLPKMLIVVIVVNSSTNLTVGAK